MVLLINMFIVCDTILEVMNWLEIDVETVKENEGLIETVFPVGTFCSEKFQSMRFNRPAE